MEPDPDLAQVRAVESAYDAAWTRGDVPGVLEHLADDVVIVSPRGEVVRGRAEAEAMLSSFLRGEARGTSHHSQVVRVEPVTADVAVVDGIATVDGLGVEPFVHRYTDVLRREDGGWRIVHIRACPGPDREPGPR